MQRIALVGSGGAGKTTFAYELASRLSLPLISLDAHYWQPGWARPDRDWWRQRQHQLLSGPSWVADGNYWSTLEVRLRRADTVVFLDRSRWVCVTRVLRRNIRHRGQTVQAAGCPERLSGSFLRYVWSFPRKHRPRLLETIATDPPEQFVWLCSQRQVDGFLAALSG